MNNLPEVVDIDEDICDLMPQDPSRNFEALFSDIYDKEGESERVKRIETKIYTYFQALQLADTPTIYDYIILSLREKDMIATFNWDPFLVQAYSRNLSFTSKLPQLVFLHGNVAVGYDNQTKNLFPLKGTPSVTNLIPTKLLYPISNKDYSSDPVIKSQWNRLLDFLDSAALITIFGYSAPKTDYEARKLMKKVWGVPQKDRYMPEIEIINIDNRDVVEKTWHNLIYSRHFTHKESIFAGDSWLFNFPRRTGEMFNERYIEGNFQVENQPPKFDSMTEMWEWYLKLLQYE